MSTLTLRTQRSGKTTNLLQHTDAGLPLLFPGYRDITLLVMTIRPITSLVKTNAYDLRYRRGLRKMAATYTHPYALRTKINNTGAL